MINRNNSHVSECTQGPRGAEAELEGMGTHSLLIKVTSCVGLIKVTAVWWNLPTLCSISFQNVPEVQPSATSTSKTTSC